MLALHIYAHESVLAIGLFQLWFEGFSQQGEPRFHLLVKDPEALEYDAINGRQVAELVRPSECFSFMLRPGGNVRIGPASLNVQKHRSNAVKIAIEAPRHIRITRPAQHGGSLLTV